MTPGPVTVPVTVLIELLVQSNDDLSTQQVCTELAAALNGAGYPFTTRLVDAHDAVAMLEDLDRGGVVSTPEQRSAVARGGPPPA